MSRRGRTVLLTTHDMTEVSRLAERVALIDHGRLMFDGPVAGLWQFAGVPADSDVALEDVVRTAFRGVRGVAPPGRTLSGNPVKAWRAARVTALTELTQPSHLVTTLFMLATQLLLTYWLWQALYRHVHASAGLTAGQATTYALLSVLYMRFRQLNRWPNGDAMQQLMLEGTIILPLPARQILTFMVPVAFIGYLPAAVLTGRAAATGVAQWLAYGAPLAGLALYAGSRYAWFLALRRYGSAGG